MDDYLASYINIISFILSVDSLLICFWQFYFLTQSTGKDFAMGVGFEWRPFLPTLKMLSLFEYQVSFRAFVCIV